MPGVDPGVSENDLEQTHSRRINRWAMMAVSEVAI